MNTRSLSTLILIGAATACMAQADAPDVISAGGGDGSSTTTQISWTIGEPVTTTVAAGPHTLTQGFQQPWAEVITLVPEHVEPGDGISVYPNPTRHVLHVKVPHVNTAVDQYHLTDENGQLLLQGRVQGTTTDLDLSRYASGNYFLRLIAPDGKMARTFKIIIAQ